MVSVSSDLTIGNEIDAVTIVVAGGELSYPFALGSGSGNTTFPIRIALVPGGMRDRQFQVEALGFLQTTPIVSQSAMVSFVPGTGQELLLFLGRNCLTVPPCPAGSTCQNSTCVTQDTVGTRRPFGSDDGGLDAQAAFDSNAVGGQGGPVASSTGGSAAGGAVGSGGTEVATGTGGAASGGTSTGGAAAGGMGTGGAASGGMGTGGAGLGGAGTGGAASGGAGGDADLVLWYKFDETSGTTAADTAMSGGTARNATLGTAGGGSASFSTTHQVGTRALSLNGSSSTVGGYATIPSLQTLAPAAMTISAWVNLPANGSAQNWQRVFDFGTSSTIYMFLSTRTNDGANAVRFAITTTGNAATAEQRLSGTTALSTNAWHHLVVVLSAGSTYTGRLYIDNVQVGTNAEMSVHASDLGATTGNYIGRSQFSAAPYFNGFIDDFRVYKRALTAAEIATLYAVR